MSKTNAQQDQAASAETAEDAQPTGPAALAALLERGHSTALRRYLTALGCQVRPSR
jgi:hypothetical protein